MLKDKFLVTRSGPCSAGSEMYDDNSNLTISKADYHKLLEMFSHEHATMLVMIRLGYSLEARMAAANFLDFGIAAKD